MATPLDHSKPLWDLYVVDGYRGGSALVSRMHHCIADGIALARVMLSLADEQRDTGIAPVPSGRDAHRGLAGELVHQARAAAGAATHAAGAVGHEGIELVTRPRSEIAHLAGEGARDARALAKICSPRRTPRPCSRARWACPAGRRGPQSSTSTRSRRSGTRAGRPSTTCSSPR